MGKTNLDDLDLATPGIEADEINTESATVGQVLTADGAGGAAFQDAAGGVTVGGDNSVVSANAGASDAYAVLLGNGAYADGGSVIAIGAYAHGGYTSVAIGYAADGSGDHGVALGHGSYATADSAVAIGPAANATASKAVAIGTLVQNPAANSVRIGWGNAAGDYMHMGDFTPTAATPTATHTIPVTLNGATYRILLSNT